MAPWYGMRLHRGGRLARCLRRLHAGLGPKEKRGGEEVRGSRTAQQTSDVDYVKAG